ncbi:MAG: glucose-6-phosphate isomerase, partial [Chloroflexota bacterium]|nr:glucose-6-phosphate isomerase [Chloroflexota bacterium]
VLCGMGGSSLAPEVINRVFGQAEGYPRFFMLDSTDPGTIEAIERRIDPANTLFIVATKSGGTTETMSFYRYFRNKATAGKRDAAGENFVAITDPGSSLEMLAREEGFRRTFLNMPDIGGRYSALSYFGLVPAALMGVDIDGLLDRAETMVEACAPCVNVEDNPGFWLGTVWGTAWQNGRDKLTIVTSPDLDSFGLWAEQLIAESTGKEGKGIVPIAGEPVGRPSAYGNDRLFVYLKIDGATDAHQDHDVQKLEDAGQPVVRLNMKSKLDLGAEFFRWEFATAVAGQMLGIDPFDEPNVQESKDNTQRLLNHYQQNGKLPEVDALIEGDAFDLYGDQEALARAGFEGTIETGIRALLSTAQEGVDYVAMLAYMPSTGEHEELFQDTRMAIRDRIRVATTFGYGPRFLHSTGQLHKGGANRGIYIQITAEPQRDLNIPGQQYSFGTLIKAQAMGDMQSLQKHGRRVIRLHIKGDHAAGVEAIREAVREAIEPLGI